MGLSRLVVMSALPSSGKSTASRYLRDTYGFTHIERDQMRIDRFGKDYVELSKDPLFHDKEALLFHEIRIRSCEELLCGRDVIVDASAVWNGTREYYLFPWYRAHADAGSAMPLASRYLVSIQASPEVRAMRDLQRDRDPSFIPPDHFERPDPLVVFPGVHVNEYTNNTPEDGIALLRGLDALFGS